MIEISAADWVPPIVQGLVRDLRVRWALEEAGLAYEPRLMGSEERASEAYRRLQPFGQLPTYVENEEAGGRLILFESGAIVLHIAERSEALLPADPAGRARAIAWIFASLNSIEPHAQNVAVIDLFHANEEWAKLRRPGAVEMAEKRLADLETWLGDRDWLEDRFTAGDLMMTTVLRLLRHTDLVTARPALEAYRLRCQARPAFHKALAAQLAPFAENAPQPA